MILDAGGIQWVSRDEACSRLGITQERLRKWRQRGKVRSLVRGKTVLVDFDQAADLELQHRRAVKRRLLAQNRNVCHD